MSVIIVSYFTGPALMECLRSVQAQDGLAEIILVNNGNSEETLFELGREAARDSRLRILSGQGNVGFAAGCNLAARRAAADRILFLNPDCVLPDGALRRGLDLMGQRPNTWLVTARLVGEDGSNQRGSRRNLPTPLTCVVEALRLDLFVPKWAEALRVNLHESAPKRGVDVVPCCSGAYMLMDKKRFREIGGFDDGYFLHVEDIDLCMAISKHGGTILYDADTTVTHRGGTSRAAAAFVEWHKARGFIRYFFKHFRDEHSVAVLYGVSAAVLLRFALRTVGLTLAAPFLRGETARSTAQIRG